MKRDVVVSRMAVAPEVAQHLFEQLSQAGVSIDLSVPFLVRVRGWQVADFCAELKIHRGYFSALLKGQYSVSAIIRYGVRQRLGFDPWRESPSAAETALEHSTHSGDHTCPQQQGAVR